MANQDSRTRLVNIRISEEEFTAIQQAMKHSGADSISGFCRNAIFNFSSESWQQNVRDIERRLAELETKATALHNYLSIALPLRTTHA
jgi:uncharacterized protein (DUF1778 family)